MEAVHTFAETIDELIPLQGSKYVQSDVRGCYQKAMNYMRQGRMVLFSGTPCQCTAASNYCRNNIEEYNELRNRLITVGVICHGVPSPDVWKSYKRWLENEFGGKLVSVNFRDKSKEGYKKQWCRYEFDNGKTVFMPSFLPTSQYMEASIVYNLDMRLSCGHCECKGITDSCDIIIGDWYDDYKGEGNLGTSCICVPTERGEKLSISALKGLREFSYDEVREKNAFIETSTDISPRRDEFLKNLDKLNWDKVEKFYPSKYPLKKLLCRIGLYDIIKGKK